VLGLLFLSILFSHLIKAFPKDLIFTFAALSNPFFGIVSSRELYQAGVNQAILAVVGLWIIGKAFEQQGLFYPAISGLLPIKKESLLRHTVFLVQVAFCGAFLNHHYFPKAALQLMTLRFEKEKTDSSILGFPFTYLFLVGGLATAIGTPVNMMFLSLYSNAVPEAISHFFAFLPLAILPILLSLLLLVALHKIFPKRLEVKPCAVIFPEPIRVKCKGYVALFFFLAAIAATFFAVAIGTAFFIAGLLLLLLLPFSIKKAFCEEFPLPLLLEIFSAAIFFFAMRNSGLSQWAASLIHGTQPFILLTLCFFTAQIAAHFMPRPVAFAVLFSIAFSLFAKQPTQLFLIGANIAFATAVPVFGVLKTDEIAISHGIRGSSPIGIRIALILILFASIAIPSCFFWPFQ
jgi:hypothetical protein